MGKRPMQLSRNEREVIRATYCSLADELREHHPNATIPEIKRALQSELDSSI